MLPIRPDSSLNVRSELEGQVGDDLQHKLEDTILTAEGVDLHFKGLEAVPLESE